MGLLDENIRSIRVYTAYGPPIEINDPFKPSPQPNPALQWLRPRIEMDTSFGPVVSQPWGDPRPGSWDLVKWIAGALALVGASVVVLRLVGKRRRRAMSLGS